MIETAPPVQAPARVRHAVWWQVYPIGFLGIRPLARIVAPAGPPVLEVPSHRWEVAF